VLKWGNDIKMDPRNNVYDVKITSLSNGELYAIAIIEDSIKLLLMSTDNGETWGVKYEQNFGSNYKISSPGIMTVRDTIVEWFVVHKITVDTFYGWVKVILPGLGENLIYEGTPTGKKSRRIHSLHLANDAPAYNSMGYIYATWCERDLDGAVSNVYFSRSNELDVSYWEVGPIVLLGAQYYSPYWIMARIAYGQPHRLWVIAPLHSWGSYPNAVYALYSDDYGNNWNQISNFRNSGETYADIAASYTDSNWVIILGRGPDRITTTDLYIYYSTDGGETWTEEIFDTSGTRAFLPDVFVDNASSSFYAVYRKNYNTFEEVIFRRGDINTPSSWTPGIVINENNTQDLSDLHEPSVGVNYSTGDAVLTWTAFIDSSYSIWFDAESRINVKEYLKDKKTVIPYVRLTNIKDILLHLSLPFSTHIKLNLYSSEGRNILAIKNSYLEKGKYIYKLNLNKSGKYFLRLKAGTHEIVKPFVFIK